MLLRDTYGLPLTCGRDAAAAYDDGLLGVLRLGRGATAAFARSIVLDPGFALGHAALALLGHEMCAPVDVDARLRDARRLAAGATERERSHVRAVDRHLQGDPAPLVRHLQTWPLDALLLSTAVPTIAFAGVSEVPEDAWRIVERAAPAYGDDWWCAGLLGFVRQEQGRFEEAMDLARGSLAQEPRAGHSAHARAHAHYETGDHRDGLAWMSQWVLGDGAGADGLSHFSWHAALHELSMGDLAAVRRRYETQLRPGDVIGCRSLVDTGSLLFRWALTPDATEVPSMTEVTRGLEPGQLHRPASPFLALHGAVALLATGDRAGLVSLERWAAGHGHPTYAVVVAPLARALRLMLDGSPSRAADGLGDLARVAWRLGGSDAQREILEETRIAALLRASRLDEARALLDARLDRRPCRRDERWRRDTEVTGA